MMACNDRDDKSPGSKRVCGKCPEQPTTEKCIPFLRNAVDRYEGRRHELDDRQRLLSDKIAIMERSIPALMAFSMWKSEQEAGGGGPSGCHALSRVREMMRKLTPTPDPADELAAELTARVQRLNCETAELHDKIISADMELEESCMELESLELANCELDAQIRQLEERLQGINLQTITSDDRLCLARIRRLGQEELRLKRSIDELEARETSLRGQLAAIMGPCKWSCRNICGAAAGKHHAHRAKNRRRKECPKLDVSVESLFERDKLCGTGCNALNKMVEKNRKCKCQEQKHESTCRKTESCEILDRKTCCRQPRKKPDKTYKSCKHNELSNKKSQKAVGEFYDCPWFTEDISSSCKDIQVKKERSPCKEPHLKSDKNECGCCEDNQLQSCELSNMSLNMGKSTSKKSLAACPSIKMECGCGCSADKHQHSCYDK